MDFSANHIGFVIASYALSVVFIGGLIIQVLLKDRKLRAEAQRLETQRRHAPHMSAHRKPRRHARACGWC